MAGQCPDIRRRHFEVNCGPSDKAPTCPTDTVIIARDSNFLKTKAATALNKLYRNGDTGVRDICGTGLLCDPVREPPLEITADCRGDIKYHYSVCEQPARKD